MEDTFDDITMDGVAEKVRIGLKNGRGTLLLAIAGIAVSVCASFMFCLASIAFDFSQLTNSAFWSRWAAMTVTTLVSYVFVILHKDEKNRLRPWYAEQMERIAEKTEIVGESFERFLRELNMHRKIEWYKRDINQKIAALNKKILELEIKGRNAERLKDKVKQYEACLTVDFIEKNKHALKTCSKPISSSQILSECNRGDRGEVNLRSAAAYYSGKAVMKVVLSLVMTAAFACVVVQNFAVGINMASIVMTVLTVLSILVSVLSAIMAANGCYKNVYVPNVLFRLKILSDFECWKKNTGKDLGANWGQTSASPQKTAVFDEKTA